MTIRWEQKRPTEVRDYLHDWSTWLGDDTIVTSTWAADGITIDDNSNTTSTVTVWLSGGTDGTRARLTNTIVTADGRTEVEKFNLLVANAEEPISLAEAKAHCRVTHSDEDPLIESYIRAARVWVENDTGHILVRREITKSFDYFPNYFDLHDAPVDSVVEIAYTDSDGVSQLFEDYQVSARRHPYRIRPVSSWPSVQLYTPVAITYLAGYEEGDAPPPLTQAMLLLIGHWHANRESVVVGAVVNEVPMAVRSLCDHYRLPLV